MQNLDELKKVNMVLLEIYSGKLRKSADHLREIKIISAWSGWGKVNSSYAATEYFVRQKTKFKVRFYFIYRSRRICYSDIKTERHSYC